jgi:hypothetical protein
MKREKEYLYKIEYPGAHDHTMYAHIDYNPDQPKPWRVCVDGTQMSPYYATIGPAQAYLRRNYSKRDGAALYYMQKSLLFDKLHVRPEDR